MHLRDSTLGYHGPSADFTDIAEFRIGWFGPTNVHDPLTGGMWWAANLAVQEANERPETDAITGRGLSLSDGLRDHELELELRRLPFRVVPRWAVDPWGTGVSQLTRMVYEAQPLALIGSVDSAATHLAEQVVAKANLPLISPITTDKSVTLAGVPWMFSCAPSDAAIARVLVDAVLAALPQPASTEMPPRFLGRTFEQVPRLSDPEPDLGGASVLASQPSTHVPVGGASVLASRAGGRNSSPETAREYARPTFGSGARFPGSCGDTAESGNQKPDIVSRIVLIAGTDHESRMTAREVMREFSRRGRVPDFRFDVTPGAAGITPQVSALADKRPAAVLIVAGAEDAARLVLAVRERLPAGRHSSPPPSLSSSGAESKPGCIIFGSHALGRVRFRELAGAAAEGVRFPLLLATDSSDPAWSLFASRFQAERGHAPDYTAVLTYDATRLLLEAIRQAGPNRARVREVLARLSPWPGLAGTIEFDGTGQNRRADLRMATFHQGALVPSESVQGLDLRPAPAPQP